jgi:hypothetical protein
VRRSVGDVGNGGRIAIMIAAHRGICGFLPTVM